MISVKIWVFIKKSKLVIIWGNAGGTRAAKNIILV